jgi:dUTP pyrophosphatase
MSMFFDRWKEETDLTYVQEVIAHIKFKTIEYFKNRRKSMTCNCSKEVILKIKKTDEKAVIPKYAHKGDAGFDFSAIIFEKSSMGEYIDEITVSPGEKYIVNTGLSMAIPSGYELQVRPRSGLAYKHGVTVINSPGTIDSTYRGTVMVILLNTGTSPFKIKTGDRIAQGVVNKLPSVGIVEVEELDDTERGKDGFGSTG